MIGDGIGILGEDSTMAASQSVLIKGFILLSDEVCPDEIETCFHANFVQGTDIFLTFDVVDLEGNPFDLSTAQEINFVLRRDITSTTADLQKSLLDSEIEFDDVLVNRFKILITKDDSNILEGNYIFETFVTMPDDTVFAVVQNQETNYGTLFVRQKISF